MKRTIAILVCIAMLLLTAGCGQKPLPKEAREAARKCVDSTNEYLDNNLPLRLALELVNEQGIFLDGLANPKEDKESANLLFLKNEVLRLKYALMGMELAQSGERQIKAARDKVAAFL